MKVVGEVNNKQLGRRELTLDVLNDGSTPSREELRNAIADRFNMKKEDVIVVRVKQDYGAKHSSVLVHEYGDERARALVQQHITARHEKKEKQEGEAKEQSKGKVGAAGEAGQTAGKAEKTEKAQEEGK